MATIKFEHLTKGSANPKIEDGYGGLIWRGFKAADVSAPNTPAGLIDLQQEVHGRGVAISTADGTVGFSAPDGYLMKDLDFFLSAATQREGIGHVFYVDAKGHEFYQIIGENGVNHINPTTIRPRIVSVTISFEDGAQFGIDDLSFKLAPNRLSPPTEGLPLFENAHDSDSAHHHLHLVDFGVAHAQTMPFDGHLALA